jgi:hypothetical protein
MKLGYGLEYPTADRGDKPMDEGLSISERADAIEYAQMRELGERIVTKSNLYLLSDGTQPERADFGIGSGRELLMGDDARLPQLHDVAVSGFIRSDHGYWGAQMIEPYVDEEVSWAIRIHQCLRFYPDESVGYGYPENYIRMFGEDYQPEPYIAAEYERAKNHKWYMSARMICVNDLYSFDPDMVVDWEQFEDILGRHFKQPPEGLGNDNTPASHMWRTLRRPCNAL